MKTGSILLTYAVSFIFLIIDFAWLGLVARDFYRDQLGSLLAPEVRWGAAFAFYALFVAGVMVFATLPAVAAGSIWRAVGLGAFFGLVTYATYDLTNLATTRGWPTAMVPVDMAWGTVLSALVATAGYLVASRLGG